MHHLLTIAGNTPYNEACTSHLRSTEEIPLDSFLSAAVGNEHYIPEQNPISREVQAVVPGPSTILAKNVSRLREEAKLTQYQLAQRAQINPMGCRTLKMSVEILGLERSFGSRQRLRCERENYSLYRENTGSARTEFWIRPKHLRTLLCVAEKS